MVHLSSRRHDSRALQARPPGLYVEFPRPSRGAAPVLPSGVPAFVGFGQPRQEGSGGSAAQLFELDGWRHGGWHADASAPRPAAGSHLEAAVRGFFANGGQRCVVVCVPWPVLPPSASQVAWPVLGRALERVFEPGGVLDERSDIDLVCVPDAGHPQLAGSRSAVFAVQRAALRHCERMGERFALLDAWRGDCADDDLQVEHGLQSSSELRSAFGALYAPWLWNDPAHERQAAHDPDAAQWRGRRGAGNPAPVAGRGCVPPCGHIAGSIARLDATRGPQRAPANLLLDDAIDTAAPLGSAARARLNEAGINAIHAVRGVGVRVGGARTRSGQLHWLYISTVRVVLAFRRWVAWRMSDLVFDTLSPALWDVIRTRLTLHCLALQRSGALVAGDPAAAFFVKCDAENNPPAERDLGRVVAHVGLAATVPAEFIVVRVVQDSNGVSFGGLS